MVAIGFQISILALIVNVAVLPSGNAQTRLQAVTFLSGEKDLVSAVIDAANGFTYWSTRHT